MDEKGAANTQAFITSTITGWVRGLFRIVHTPGHAMFGKPMNDPLCKAATAYSVVQHWNDVDQSLDDGKDPYIKATFENMRKEHGGSLPCLYLELLVMTAARLLDDITSSAHVADMKSLEDVTKFCAVYCSTWWRVKIGSSFHEMIQKSTCKNPATTTGKCCSKQKPRFVVATRKTK